MPSLWSSLADLPLRIDDYSVERRDLAVSPQFTRVTTTVVLRGDGAVGEGEDVTYTASDHDEFPDDEMLAGSWTLAEYSLRLNDLTLFASDPQMEASHDYRRWAFESAALDLALRQGDRSLAHALDRPYRPLRFVASTRADTSPYRELYPALEFKLDVEENRDRTPMERLAATDRVRVLDLKAYYRNTGVDLAPDPELYRLVVEAFPGAVIEDAWLEDGCLEALAGAEGRRSLGGPGRPGGGGRKAGGGP